MSQEQPMEWRINRMTLDDVMGFLSLISDDIKENNQEHRGTGVVAAVYGDNLLRV
jgi:hypothetical protein